MHKALIAAAALESKMKQFFVVFPLLAVSAITHFTCIFIGLLFVAGKEK